MTRFATSALTRTPAGTRLPKPKVAVFVGSGAGPDVSLKLDKGPRVYTVWGYLAWRLAGDAGLKVVAEAETARTSPGSGVLVELFKLAGPSVILLDELTRIVFRRP
jgi:predicted AAA+ superfamily ATPase